MNFITAIDRIAYIVIESLINSFWQGILLVAITSFVLFIFRKLNATTRYLILGLTLLILAFMPFLNILSITSRSINFMSFSDQHQMFSLNHESNISSSVNSEENFIADLPQFKSINIPIPLEMLPSLILGLWALMTVFMLSRLLKSLFYTNSLRRNLLALSPEYQQKITELMRSTDTKRKIDIYTTDNVKMPMAIGLFNPVILIPDRLMNKLTEEQLKQVILHELAHIRRWDNWTNLIQKIFETFYFWNPMVLWLGRRLNLEREIACDDWVITFLGKPNLYALCLTKLIEFRTMSSQTIANGAVLHKKHIAKRIKILLDKGRDTTSQFSRLGILVTICVIIPVFAAFIKITPVIALVRQQKNNPETILQAEKTFIPEHIANQKLKIKLPSKVEQKVEDNLNEIDRPSETVQHKTVLLKNSLTEEPLEVSANNDNMPDNVDKTIKNDIPDSLYAPADKSKDVKIESKYSLESEKSSSQNVISQITDDKKKIQLTTVNLLDGIRKSLKDTNPSLTNMGFNKTKTVLYNSKDGKINQTNPATNSQLDSKDRRNLAQGIHLVKVTF